MLDSTWDNGCFTNVTVYVKKFMFKTECIDFV